MLLMPGIVHTSSKQFTALHERVLSSSRPIADSRFDGFFRIPSSFQSRHRPMPTSRAGLLQLARRGCMAMWLLIALVGLGMLSQMSSARPRAKQGRAYPHLQRFQSDHQLLGNQSFKPKAVHDGPTRDQKDLLRIFTETGTDKKAPHNYDVYYGRHLSPFRHLKGLRMLEIGANSGVSLAAWGKFFSDPVAIHAISYVNPADRGSRASKDVSQLGAYLDCKAHPFPHCDRVRLFYGDQSDLAFLRGDITTNGAGFANGKAPSTYKDPSWKDSGYDIIIDDGSHFPAHMVITFQELFSLVRPGGLYVIEDIETNYWRKGRVLYGYKIYAGIGTPFDGPSNTGSAVEKFKEIIDVLQKYQAGVPELTLFGQKVDGCISEISFGNNNIIIRKETPYEQTRRPALRMNERVDRDGIRSWMAKARNSNPPK